MKIHILSSVCAVLVVFAHFLTFAPLTHAQSQIQSPVEGLRFDTPLPDNYSKKTFSLYFLASYDMKSSELLTVKKSMPTPLAVTAAATSTSVLDLLTPVAEAAESTASGDVEKKVTLDVLAAADEPAVDVLLEPEADIVPSPSAKATKKPELAASPTLTPAPTVTPTTAPTSAPTAVPTAEPVQSSGGLSADKIFELVNNYRATKGLVAVQKDERACEVARSRAPEIGAEISGGYMHRGIRQRNLPYFNSEIIISMRSEEAAVNWWISDRIHREQMEGDYKYSCAACSGNSCVQEFTNFVPKG